MLWFHMHVRCGKRIIEYIIHYLGDLFRHIGEGVVSLNVEIFTHMLHFQAYVFYLKF